MEIMEKEQLKSALASHWVETRFTKTDGSLRTMICTRDLNFIKEDPSYVEIIDDVKKPPRKVNEDLFTVWEKNKGWRSFKYSSLLKTEIMEH